MATIPSGRQFEIGAGDLTAVVVEVGGGIRGLWQGARPLLDPFPAAAMSDGGHGSILAPWPNRLVDGRYAFDGVEHQLDLSEPERHNAIHGLVRWRAWRPMRRERERVVMGLRLYPTPGYPFAVDLRADYVLRPQGLRVALAARNVGDGPCPWAVGQHLYLSAGTGTIDSASLRLPAATRLTVDPDRLVPAGRAPTVGTPFDFGAPTRLGARRLDDAFTDLERDAEGRAWALVRGADGGGAALWLDRAFAYAQVYTGDHLAPDRRRRGLAVEPMTAPANALRSGEGLVRLEPGARTRAVWGIEPLPPT